MMGMRKLRSQQSVRRVKYMIKLIAEYEGGIQGSNLCYKMRNKEEKKRLNEEEGFQELQGKK